MARRGMEIATLLHACNASCLEYTNLFEDNAENVGDFTSIHMLSNVCHVLQWKTSDLMSTLRKEI